MTIPDKSTTEKNSNISYQDLLDDVKFVFYDYLVASVSLTLYVVPDYRLRTSKQRD